ncbi:MAG: hypothetical protein E7043_03950 [Lentisphaerae bacterium]|nr:hypothetical protein [Lentisphaerota bacterium]
MTRDYIKGQGTFFLRRKYDFPADGDFTIKISADPHTYIRDFCQYTNRDHWLMGGTYIKYHVWFDGEYVGCGTERAVIDNTRVEHRFKLNHICSGIHCLAIVFRGEKQGLNAGVFTDDDREVTGTAWKSLDGNRYDAHFCYRQQNIYGYFKGDVGPGEFFEHLDGTFYPDNWQMPDFDDSSWMTPVIESAEYPTVPAEYNLDTFIIHPQKLYKTSKNSWIADFGEISIASLILTGPGDGGEVEIRLGEELIDPEHVKYQLRCTVCYQENWLFAPGHQQLGNFGVREFRYAEIVNYSGELRPEDIAIRRIHAPFNDSSVLKTDNKNMQAIWDLCKRTVKNTATDTFTDCFTRERIAYEADAYLNMSASFAVTDSLLTARRHLEYQLYHLTWPVEWKQYLALLVYEYYWESGEAGFVEKHFDKLMETSSFIDCIGPDGWIRSFGKDCRHVVDWPPVYAEKYDFGNNEYLTVTNAFAGKVLITLSELAGVIGRKELAADLLAKGKKIFRRINECCFDEKRRLYKDHPGSDHCSFYANMWVLWCSAADEERVTEVLDFIDDCGMVCSLYSGFIYLETLFRFGRGKKAADLLLSDDSPWMEMIRQGFTITSEFWPKKDQRMSLAHPWGSYPAYLIARYIFGLKPTSPGWKSYAAEPVESGITGASLTLNKRYRQCCSEL